MPTVTRTATTTSRPGVKAEERAAEVERLLERTRDWAAARPDVAAVGLAGSWARGEAHANSDVDLPVLTDEPRRYLEDEGWVRALGGLRTIKMQTWGPLTERRFVLPSGLEVESGIATPSWPVVDPVDPGTLGVVRDGFRAVYDPEGLLARLVEACR